VLSDDFANTIRSLVKRFGTGLGDSVETNGREALVDIFGVYALYAHPFLTHTTSTTTTTTIAPHRRRHQKKSPHTIYIRTARTATARTPPSLVTLL
jgi:hypothetical protein